MERLKWIAINTIGYFITIVITAMVTIAATSYHQYNEAFIATKGRDPAWVGEYLLKDYWCGSVDRKISAEAYKEYEKSHPSKFDPDAYLKKKQ